MLSTIDFERFLLASPEVKKFVEKRIIQLERKYIPGLTDESFGIRELLSTNVVLKIFIEDIVPRRLGVAKEKISLKEKLKIFFKNIKRTNIMTDESTTADIESKFSEVVKEIDMINRFRQEYIIAKAEVEKRKGIGFLSSILNKIKVDGVLFFKDSIYKLRLTQNRNGLKVYVPSKELFTYDTFFKNVYYPLVNNYINSLAIKYVWETREGLINKILREVPSELLKLIMNASKSQRWFIEVGDIGLERQGDTYYLYQWTGEFALIELLNSSRRGELYLFPNFKVAVPFKVSREKINISPAVVIDPPTLHPFLPASSSSIRNICFGPTAQAYSNVAKRGTVDALLAALEMAVIMIKEGYRHGAGPYRTLSECNVRNITYKDLKKRGIPVTNISDKEARELLRSKWGARI